MKIISRPKFFTGIIIIIFLTTSYFIKILIESGSNYEDRDRLLGILIFHNPFVLGIYALILAILIITSFKRIKLI